MQETVSSESGDSVANYLEHLDEIILEFDENMAEEYKQLINDGMDQVNQQLKLNRELACDVQCGKNYSEIH